MRGPQAPLWAWLVGLTMVYTCCFYLYWGDEFLSRGGSGFFLGRPEGAGTEPPAEGSGEAHEDCWADLSVMSLNVEEFFEPCLRRLKRWQGTSGGGSIDDFARQYPDVLEAAFVMRHGPSPATPDACGNQSARQWGNATVAAVRELILRAAADVVLLQEHALTRSAVVPRGYRLAVVADTGEPGWKDVRLANAVLVREGLDVLGSFAISGGVGRSLEEESKSWRALVA
ncbi:unnamed protein product, partial [Prorocentrum cordatum]